MKLRESKSPASHTNDDSVKMHYVLCSMMQLQAWSIDAYDDEDDFETVARSYLS